jgi:hypothetical protein
MLLPVELPRDRRGGGEAQAGHAGEELAQARGVAVERAEEVVAAVADLVLRLAGAQALGQRAPERVQPRVAHLEDAAGVRGLGLVEEEVRVARVAVLRLLTGPVALEHLQGHQRVEEVAGRARV